MLCAELWCVTRSKYIDDNEDIRSRVIGGISVLTLPDGSDKTHNFVLHIGNDYNGSQAEVLASIASLKSLKDEYRVAAKTKFHAPSTYVRRALIRKPDGEWYMNAAANVELIQQLRSLFLTYSDIEVVKRTNDKQTQECNRITNDKLNETN